MRLRLSAPLGGGAAAGEPGDRPSFAAHRAAASGLFVLFSLLVAAFGFADPRAISAAAAVSLASLWIFSRPGVRRGLGPFASPLAMLLDMCLLVAGMSIAGGARSPYALLLPAGLAMAWSLEGRAAARFYAALSVLAAGALLLGIVSLDDPAGRFPLLALVLTGPALLAALEAAAGGRPTVTAASPAGVASAAPAGGVPAAPRARADEEILHDLRSPLSVIRVYTDLIAERARRGELPNAEHLANLKREVDLAEQLVEGASGTAGAGHVAPKAPVPPAEAPPQPAATADLVEILGSLATAYRLSRAGSRRIEFIAERPQLPVAAEPVALQRALRNVIENAIKYTAEGGEIRIRAGAAGAHAFVVVKDTGIGMSAEERARAFDYAFRGSGAVATGQPGKGIGLALTKEILEANGGRISLSSEAGFGSEVTILIPFRRGDRG
ncbi:MAG: sensor histidine kinase [Thermoanaerobaculia bacterium]